VPNKYVPIDGVAAYVHHTGATTLPEVLPDLSRGEVVLCLHGNGASGGIFAPLLERLAADHSPLAFDQPGHGRSGDLDSLGSIEKMAEFTRAFCERFELDRPVLLGHSMGGAVAICYALQNPDAVRALVLCSSGARFEMPPERIEQQRLISEGKARREFRRDLYSPAASPDVMRQGFGEMLKTDPRAAYGDALACRDWNAEDSLESLSVPLLVAVGEDDFPNILDQAERLGSGNPRARKVVVPKAGHMLPIEQPDALAEAVLAFLAEIGS
jgi:3-oxoadipate enol-lactonase